MAITIARRLHRRIGDRPAKLAFRISNTPLVRRRLARGYERALMASRLQLPVLSGIDLDIVNGLERDGIYVTSLEALGIPGSAEMLRKAQKAATDFSVTARQAAAGGRDFTQVPAATLMENPQLFAWGLSDRLLDIAEAYLGLPVAYDGLAILYTVADGREVATRQWHRDREDRKMLKVAVYCSDVGEGGGAFELISRIDAKQDDAHGFRYAGGAEEELCSLLGPDYRDAIVTCNGSAGTVVFADTARYFHRGQPVYKDDRKAAFFTYFARKTRHPYFCERSGLTRAELVRLAAGMAPRQKASILWRAAQPFWSRLIPPAPV